MERKWINRLLDKTERMGEFCYKYSFVMIVSVLFFCVIPVIWLGFYNSASVDDYSFSAYSKIVFEDTGSVFRAIGQAFLTTYDRYFTWQGTYAASFLISLQPGIWNYHFYSITPFISLLSIGLAQIYLIAFILKEWLGCKKREIAAVWALCMILAIELMPSPLEGLFWYTGFAAYISSYVFMLLLLTNVIKLLLGRTKHEKAVLATSFLLAFLTGGGNYITGLFCAVVLSAFAGYALVFKKAHKSVCAVWCVFFAGFILNICAPGNAVRQAEMAQHSGAAGAIAMSFCSCLEALGEWSNWIYFMWLAACALLIFPAVKKSQNCIHPAPALICSVCLLSSMYTPVRYAGNASAALAGRVVNVIYLVFLMLSLVNLCNAMIWLKNRYTMREEKRLYGKTVFLLVVCATVFFGGISAWIGNGKYTSIEAFEMIRNGQARTYADENLERERLLTQGAEDVVLKAHTVFPYLLYLTDITEDPEDWTNRHMCRYYQLKTVRLQR